MTGLTRQWAIRIRVLFLVPKRLRTKDSVEAYHRKAQGHKPWLRWCGLQKDNTLLGIWISYVLPELMEIAIVMAASEENLLALKVLQEMFEHFCRSVSLNELARGFEQLETHFSS